MQTWHIADHENRMYCNLTDGKKIAMPRYYKQKIYTDEQRKIIGEATRARMEQKSAGKEKLSIEQHIKQIAAANHRMVNNGFRNERL